jgi:hypothetical protein
MSRKSRGFRKAYYPPFGMLPNYMTDSAAWKSLSPVAVKAFIELVRMYKGHNNGRIAMGVRTLAELTGCSKSTADRALTELELKGFIGVQRLGTYGCKVATEYFLTQERNDVSNDVPTKAFMRWKPATPDESNNDHQKGEKSKERKSSVPKKEKSVPPMGLTQQNYPDQSHWWDCVSPKTPVLSPTSGTHLVSLIDSFVGQLSQVFMLRVFHVGTIC